VTIALRDPSSWAARNAVIDLHRFALPLTKDRASRPTEYGAWGAERWWTQDGSTPCALPVQSWACVVRAASVSSSVWSVSRQCRADPQAAVRVAKSGGVDAAVAVLTATGGAEALGLLWTLRWPCALAARRPSPCKARKRRAGTRRMLATGANA
jgi:hypothetical protein